MSGNLYKEECAGFQMRDDTGKTRALKSFRKLLYFYDNKILVHFKDINEIFYNGNILDLNEDKLCMVLNERVNGMMPLLLEQINPDTIKQFKEKGA